MRPTESVRERPKRTVRSARRSRAVGRDWTSEGRIADGPANERKTSSEIQQVAVGGRKRRDSLLRDLVNIRIGRTAAASQMNRTPTIEAGSAQAPTEIR